ncbi:MAG: penicillin-binding protein activator [Deltaproteobacteria bacterium]|nr:penicillin-binding protein activator [Deltaproteobacteria bacterium]
MIRVFMTLLFFTAALSFSVVDALAEEPAETELLSILGEIEQKGSDDAIVSRLEDFIQIYPREAVSDEAMYRLGGIFMDKGEFAKASKVYEELLLGFPLSRFKAETLLKLGYCHLRLGHLNDARASFEAVVLDETSTVGLKVRAGRFISDVSRVKAAVQELSGKGETTHAVGALLPIKGSFAVFGEKALEGVVLAASVFSKSARPVAVHIMDEGADEKGVANTIAELSSEKDVIALMGPLLSLTAVGAAEAAEVLRLPILSLSQKEGLPQIGDYVFRNSLIPSMQAAEIVVYACQELGLKRFMVLYPETPYGTELARLFREDVLKCGGAIVGEVSYPEGKADFGTEVRRLFGVKVVEEEVKKAKRKYIATIEADALFIPDYHETVVQIAPHLAYYDIKNVRLLGANGWNSKKLIELGGSHVEGAVFVDGFFAGSKRRATREFVENFKRFFGREPGFLEAQAYDSAMIVFQSIAAGAEDRESLKTRLMELRDFEGATGNISFDEKGEAGKRLFLLTVNDREIVEVMPMLPTETIQGE